MNHPIRHHAFYQADKLIDFLSNTAPALNVLLIGCPLLSDLPPL